MVLIKYDKVKIILSNSLYSILNQLNFYKKYNYLKSPFISKIYYAFQDKSAFYLVKKFYSGGDLRYHINRKIISEEKSKFLVANIILGLEFLHSKGYIYRNLIPENLLIDKKGYLHLNDMTLMREMTNITFLVSSGHPGYMAPEIIFRQKHSIESDFFSLGVILYEMMFNKLPYKSNSREEYLNDLSSTHNALIKEDELNIGWSRECADFINRCIQKRAEYRIGFGGIEELKSHIWIKDFNWAQLEKKELEAPFIPRGKNNYSLRNYNEEEYNFFKENIYNFIEYYETMNFFNGYYYNYNLDKNFNKEKMEIKELDGNNNEQKIEDKDLNDNFSKEDIEGNEKVNFENNNTPEEQIYIMNNKNKREKINDEEDNEKIDNNDDVNNNNFENFIKNKKNKKNKKKNEEENNLETFNHKENNKNKKKKKRRESNDTKNYYEDESKGQLMNLNNKKGLFNKTGNRRKISKNKKSSKKLEHNESNESLKIDSNKKK